MWQDVLQLECHNYVHPIRDQVKTTHGYSPIQVFRRSGKYFDQVFSVLDVYWLAVFEWEFAAEKKPPN